MTFLKPIRLLRLRSWTATCRGIKEDKTSVACLERERYTMLISRVKADKTISVFVDPTLG